MKSFLYAFVSIGLTFSSFAEAPPSLYPRLKVEERFNFPAHFRKAIPFCDNVSASSQFSEKELQYLVEHLPVENLIVVDLRREFHGFINGSPVSWKREAPGVEHSFYDYNTGLTGEEIERREEALLATFPLHEIFSFRTEGEPLAISIESIATERELVESYGGHYVRFPLTDHQFPSDEEVDHFVAWVRSLPSDAYLHFHSAGGEGRTTLFLSMLDMMQSAREFSVEEILKRQEAIGGSNLYDPELYYADEPDRIEGAKRRYAFLQKFHQYCLENPDFQKSWTSSHEGIENENGV